MSVTTKHTTGKTLYETYHDRTDDTPVTETIVEALAAAEGVEPVNLDARLYDSIDPDALERLYEVAADRTERLQVSFTAGEYEVTVESDGRVLVHHNRKG